VTLSGRSAGKRENAGRCQFSRAGRAHGWVESAHQLIVHYWLTNIHPREGRHLTAARLPVFRIYPTSVHLFEELA
jgi:hypothetical protein